MPLDDMHVVTPVSAKIASGWNYACNLTFDRATLQITGVRKRVAVRVPHVALFQTGLPSVLPPFILRHLGVTPLRAFLIDIGFAASYPIYAFVFDWVHDLVFPIPEAGSTHG